MTSFPRNLYYYRRREGLSQEQLANRIGVTKHTIVNYEGSKSVPSMDMVIRLAHALNVTTDQLLGFEIPIK